MSPERIVFRCARDGLAATLEGGLLGGYDGAGAWSLILGNIAPGDEQLMVETHEGLHHELQASTAYGRVTASARLLARRGFRSAALTELFFDMVDRSHGTHEAFATTVSASVVGVARARELFTGNTDYLGHLDRGHGLAGPATLPWRIRETASASVLRAVMSPEALFDVLARGFDRLTRRAFDEGDHPDVRLAAFERAGGPDTWAYLVRDLAAEFPDHALDAGDPDRRELPDDADLDRVRAFEEDVVLRRCYEHVSDVLAREGLRTIPWDRQLEAAELFKDEVGRVDPELGERLAVVAERRPVLDDALEYDRQGIELRGPLPARTVDVDTTLASLRAFQSWDVDGDPHVCGVWLGRRVARKQFAFQDELPDPVVALMAPMRFPDGEVLVFGLLPSDWTPRQVQDVLGDVPLLVLTTHHTLTDDGTTALLRTVEPVFVLMDLPVAWHVEDWLRQDAAVRMALVPLDGFEGGDLLLLAFDVDRSPGFRFVHVGGRTAVSLLAERLRLRHGDRLEITAEVLREDAVALNYALNHVLGAWRVLDQDGVE